MQKIWVDADSGVNDTFVLEMLFEALAQVEVTWLSTARARVDLEQQVFLSLVLDFSS